MKYAQIFFVFYITIFSFAGIARNVERYPRESFEFAGNIIHNYRGVLDEIFPLSLQVGIDSEFSLEQREILDLSLQILIERITSPNVIDCAFRRSYRGMPKSRASFIKELYNSLRPLALDEHFIPSFAFIAAYDSDPLTVGLGYVGLFYDTEHQLPGYNYRHYLYVAINKDHLGEAAEYVYRNDINYWAGVLAHEFLHNLGYDHPHNSSGYFINEFGSCVSSDGIGESIVKELQDKKVYKSQKDL